MDWAKSPQCRDQLVLFPSRLDDAIRPDHNVRLLDDILRQLDWSEWESAYDLRRGQPPIHPRILASVILYGLLTRIRTSRALEEALEVRLDFRWLVEGRSIDHTTLSEFRRKNAIEEGDILAYGAEMNPSGLKEAIDRTAAAIDWGKPETSDDPTKEIGKGFAVFWKAPAMPPNASSASFLKFNEDGSLNITVSGMELGQGYLTAMAQIAGEVLAVPPSKIKRIPVEKILSRPLFASNRGLT